jgi:hypothetical protein
MMTFLDNSFKKRLTLFIYLFIFNLISTFTKKECHLRLFINKQIPQLDP